MNFEPEQVFELTKTHCKTSKIELDELQLISIIDKKNNSDFLMKKFESKKSQILNEGI